MTIVPFDLYPDPRAIALRVAPIDVGFDLRLDRISVKVPPDATVASYADQKGERWVVTGNAADIATALTRAGYTCLVSPMSKRR